MEQGAVRLDERRSVAKRWTDEYRAKNEGAKANKTTERETMSAAVKGRRPQRSQTKNLDGLGGRRRWLRARETTRRENASALDGYSWPQKPVRGGDSGELFRHWPSLWPTGIVLLARGLIRWVPRTCLEQVLHGEGVHAAGPGAAPDGVYRCGARYLPGRTSFRLLGSWMSPLSCSRAFFLPCGEERPFLIGCLFAI